MKLYIAGRYARRDEFSLLRIPLRQAGITVTSRWLDEKHSLIGSTSELTPTERVLTALKDVEDVVAADGLLFFAEAPYDQPPRGGRHVEFGMAIALGKPIFVIGEAENIFHYYPDVKHFSTFEEFLQNGPAFPATLAN